MAPKLPELPESPDFPEELTDLGRSILEVVWAIDAGDVMTYGEVAAEAGNPGAARAVGGVLRRHGDGFPWWRVVASNGRLVPGGEARHRAHLRAEGITVRNNRVVMSDPPSP